MSDETWNAETVYQHGARVTHAGKTYVARHYSVGQRPDENCEDGKGLLQGKSWVAE